MSIQFISVKCPECGATLSIEENRAQAFCTYCGAKILIHNENEFIYHHIDEAEVTSAETDRIIRMKEMELKEKKFLKNEQRRSLEIKIYIIVVAVSAFFGVLSLLLASILDLNDTSKINWQLRGGLGFLVCVWAVLLLVATLSNNSEEDDDISVGDKAKIPTSVMEYEKKNYTTIESILVSAGFTNVTCIPLNDLRVGFLQKPGTVESITLNGEEGIFIGKYYPKDAAIVITYHSLNR